MGVPTGKGEARDFEAEAKAFNIERRSIAAAKGSVVGEVRRRVQAYTKAFDRYLRVGEKALTPDEARAMSVGTDSPAATS
jgi:hypothetical protein